MKIRLGKKKSNPNLLKFLASVLLLYSVILPFFSWVKRKIAQKCEKYIFFGCNDLFANANFNVAFVIPKW